MSSTLHGERQAGEDLIPLVYEELHRLAAHQMANERPGHTLQATALVHEAYLRLVGSGPNEWKSRRHFFGAAAEAMRRILVESARRKLAVRRGGDRQRVELRESALAFQTTVTDVDILAIHEALDDLAEVDAVAAELVKLRFFVGLTHAQAAELLDLSRSAADRAWIFARAWLFQHMQPEQT
jgi:RNA polymerase sigma factor (TIGR02999 family)